jgi:archaemetzincin
MATSYASSAEIEAAVGDLDSLPPELRRAFTIGTQFEPLPRPGPNDWLTINPESGQTYQQFVKSGAKKPVSSRNTIYFQLLDRFRGRDPKELKKLTSFAKAFFQLPVIMQSPVNVKLLDIKERRNPHSGQRQLLTTDIMEFLVRDLPRDAYCRLGITTIDLYPEPSWNFVFGQAYLMKRTGVYSFARYDPAFYGESPKAGDEKISMLRNFKVLAHETGHMFGIEHCVYMHCLMNGSNHLEETDASPVHLCPVCLRKLQQSVGFDVVDRYRRLEAAYSTARLWTERKWVNARADFVLGE